MAGHRCRVSTGGRAHAPVSTAWSGVRTRSCVRRRPCRRGRIRAAPMVVRRERRPLSRRRADRPSRSAGPPTTRPWRRHARYRYRRHGPRPRTASPRRSRRSTPRRIRRTAVPQPFPLRPVRANQLLCGPGLRRRPIPFPTPLRLARRQLVRHRRTAARPRHPPHDTQRARLHEVPQHRPQRPRVHERGHQAARLGIAQPACPVLRVTRIDDRLPDLELAQRTLRRAREDAQHIRFRRTVTTHRATNLSLSLPRTSPHPGPRPHPRHRSRAAPSHSRSPRRRPGERRGPMDVNHRPAHGDSRTPAPRGSRDRTLSPRGTAAGRRPAAPESPSPSAAPGTTAAPDG